MEVTNAMNRFPLGMHILPRLLAPLALLLTVLLAVASGPAIRGETSALAGMLALAAVALVGRRQAPAYARPRTRARGRLQGGGRARPW